MDKQKYILDTDPGIDDALAIALACQCDEIELLGVCAVAGNTPLDHTYPNAVNIMKLCGASHIPVLRGYEQPLRKHLVSDAAAHGENGLDGYCFTDQPKVPKQEEAVAFMTDMVSRFPHEVMIVAVGPLTNVAAAIKRDPSFSENVKGILAMGGAAYVPGNVSATAEFNIKTDPYAAQIVVNSGIDVSFIPLDITLQTRLSEEAWKTMCETKNQITDFLSSVLTNRYAVLSKCGEYGYPMHDPLTIGALVHPEWIQYEDVYLQIETCAEAISEGMFVIDKRKNAPPANVHMGVGVNHQAFLTMYQNKIKQY